MTVLSSRWLSGVRGLFPSTVTFYEATENKASSHETTRVWDKAVTGFVGLGCRVAPAGGGKVKTGAETYVVCSHTLSLPADATLLNERMRAVVTGPNAGTYDIVLVQVGSEGVLSRVLLELVR